MKNIFLYGPPASGKSTLGKMLAKQLNVEFVDLDVEIERANNRSISEIFAQSGEAAFRAMESFELRKVAERERALSQVVALGGGTLLDSANRAYCEANGVVVCIDTPDEAELNRRIAAAGGTRPLGNRALERAPHYASFPHRISTWFDVGDSLVIVGRGYALSMLGGMRVVSDANVGRLYADELPSPIATIPSGEAHKTIDTICTLWHAFAEAGLGRKDMVVAVGGGVTGDLTGFAAATWMRGMNWINVPTTLLSMVDASTGGKTGCDLPEGKNLAGAFHSPRLVLIDTDFLKTLSTKLLSDGRAEMIKHEIIGGKDVASGNELTPQSIARNLMVKVEIVRKDPLELLGSRINLNCGHTVAHAIEKLSDYRVSHGEAVAIGCVVEAKLAVARHLADANWPKELAARFASFGLPTELPQGITWEAMIPVMLQDKKHNGNTITFALPCGWGKLQQTKIEITSTFGQTILV